MNPQQHALDRAFSPCLTLVQDAAGYWHPNCHETGDKLRAIGITWPQARGISTAALDDILYNVSEHGYCLETVPNQELAQ